MLGDVMGQSMFNENFYTQEFYLNKCDILSNI